MGYKNIVSELDDRQIEELAAYAAQCTEQNIDNIKSKFYSRINNRRKLAAKRKMFFVASIAAAFLLLSGFVYAGIVDLREVYEMVFGSKAEYMSQYGTIINGGNIDNGIQLNLLSAIKDEDKMLIFFTLTDTEQDRLSATMDLYDSWSLDQGYGGNCKIISYDAATKTANCMITSVGASTNKTAVLTIKSFLKSREFRDSIQESDINVKELLSGHTAKTVAFSEFKQDGYGTGVSTGSRYNDDEVLDKLLLLKQEQLTIPFSNIDWSVISNIGFADGELHIQTKPSENTFSSIISMYFVDENNTTVFTNELSVSYGNRGDKGTGAYNEFIFENIHDISQLQNLRLVMDVVEYGDYFTGNWSASFIVPPQATKITIPMQDTLTLANEVVEAYDVTLSPLGLTIRYKSETFNPTGENTDNAFVTYDDGTVVKFQSISRGMNEKNVTYSFSDLVIEIEKVVSVNINGQEFNVNHE